MHLPPWVGYVGFSICLLGLLVASLSLFPGLTLFGDSIIPIFVGAAIYLPGAFMVFFTARYAKRKDFIRMLFVVRLLFVGIVITAILRTF